MNSMNPTNPTSCHCEERSDDAISGREEIASHMKSEEKNSKMTNWEFWHNLSCSLLAEFADLSKRLVF